MAPNLVAEGAFVDDETHLRLTQDYVFTSPSNAAVVLLARTAYGRIEWTDADGVTLKDLQQREVSGPP